MFKKVLVIVIVIVAVLILIGLVRQINDALKSDQRLEQILEDVSGLEKENKDLKKELASAETYDAVEEVARNDLNMSFQDETVVIVPESLVEHMLAPVPPPVEIETANWEGWMRLFFR